MFTDSYVNRVYIVLFVKWYWIATNLNINMKPIIISNQLMLFIVLTVNRNFPQKENVRNTCSIAIKIYSVSIVGKYLQLVIEESNTWMPIMVLYVRTKPREPARNPESEFIDIIYISFEYRWTPGLSVNSRTQTTKQTHTTQTSWLRHKTDNSDINSLARSFRKNWSLFLSGSGADVLKTLLKQSFFYLIYEHI